MFNKVVQTTLPVFLERFLFLSEYLDLSRRQPRYRYLPLPVCEYLHPLRRDVLIILVVSRACSTPATTTLIGHLVRDEWTKHVSISAETWWTS